LATLDYDPTSGTIMLVTDHGTLSYDGCGPDLEFCRQVDNGMATAFWLDPNEAGVLLKMVRYCLKLEKLSPTSRAVLEALDPRLAALVESNGGE
jgi:hypothetical protein